MLLCSHTLSYLRRNSGEEGRTVLMRFNPPNLGSYPLDESRTTILKAMLVSTLKYLEESKQQHRVKIMSKTLNVTLPLASSPPSPASASLVPSTEGMLSSSSTLRALPLPLEAYEVQEEFEEKRRKEDGCDGEGDTEISPLALSTSCHLPWVNSTEALSDFVHVRGSPINPRVSVEKRFEPLPSSPLSKK
jgi:hypothetical protein